MYRCHLYKAIVVGKDTKKYIASIVLVFISAGVSPGGDIGIGIDKVLI